MAVDDPSPAISSAAEPALYLKYWGVTGSFSAPWQPRNAQEWLVRVVLALRERNLLGAIQDQSLSRAALQELLESNLDPTLLAGPRRQTTCIEIRTPLALILVDAGSGLQDCELRSPLPNWPALPSECHLWLTHGHWDHLLGLPFYSGFFTAEPRFTVWGSARVLTLLRMMFDRESAVGETLIPTNFEHLRALKELRAVNPNEQHQIADLKVSTLALHHPAGSMAYRFEYGGRSVVIATDHEQDNVLSPNTLIEFARGADLLYLDAQYTQAEYLGQRGIAGEPPQARQGWGHSTMETSVAVGIAAGVKELHLGHHDPRRSDCELMQLEESAKSLGSKLLKAQNRNAQECLITFARAGQTWFL
jgi:phosphoribosyl 1,2-cyclic phosphodiesterase